MVDDPRRNDPRREGNDDEHRDEDVNEHDDRIPENPVVRVRKETYKYYSLDVANAREAFGGMIEPLPLFLRPMNRRVGYGVFSYGSVPYIVRIKDQTGGWKFALIYVPVRSYAIYAELGDKTIADISRPAILIAYDFPKPWVEPAKTMAEIYDRIRERRISAPQTPSDAYSELRRLVFSYLVEEAGGIPVEQSVILIPLRENVKLEDAIIYMYSVISTVLQLVEQYLEERIIPWFGTEWAVFPAIFSVVLGYKGEELTGRMYTLESIASKLGLTQHEVVGPAEATRRIEEAAEHIVEEAERAREELAREEEVREVAEQAREIVEEAVREAERRVREIHVPSVDDLFDVIKRAVAERLGEDVLSEVIPIYVPQEEGGGE